MSNGRKWTTIFLFNSSGGIGQTKINFETKLWWSKRQHSVYRIKKKILMLLFSDKCAPKHNSNLISIYWTHVSGMKVL